MSKTSQHEHQFIAQLQAQAERQAQLEQRRLLPKHVDWLTGVVGNHPWQTLVVLATLSTLLMIAIHQL